MNGATAAVPAGIGAAVNRTMLAIFAVCWVALLVFTFLGLPGADQGVRMLLVLAATVLWIAGMRQTAPLGHAARMARTRSLPVRLWQDWLRAALRSTTLYWAAISAAMMVQFAIAVSQAASASVQASPLPLAMLPPALLSPVLCLSVLRTLSAAGLAPRWLGIAANAAGIAALACLAGGYIPTVENAIASLPATAQLAAALAWPAMAWMLSLRWQAAPPAQATQLTRHAHGARPAPGMAQRLTGFCERYTVLRWDQETDYAGRPKIVMRGKVAGVLNAQAVTCLFVVEMLSARWGEQLPPVRLVWGFVVCTMLVSNLLVRDLGWRTMLLPGGARPRRIGTHILLSNLIVQLICLAVLACGTAFTLLALGHHPAAVADSILGMASVPFELACLTSLAIVVRAAPKKVLLALIATGVAGGLFFAVSLGRWGLRLWAIGPAYLAVLVALAIFLTWLANRLWTPEKLLRQMN